MITSQNSHLHAHPCNWWIPRGGTTTAKHSYTGFKVRIWRSAVVSCTRRCHRIQGRESRLSVVVWPQIRLRAPRTWLTTGHDFTRPTFFGESSQVLFQILLLQARSSLTSIMHFKPQHACYFCLTPTCHLCLIQLQSRKCQTQS